MRKFLSYIPTPTLAIIAIILALAPFVSEPHLLQKLRMLFNDSLSRPIDIFDLFLHGTALALLLIKIFFMIKDKKH